MNHPLDTFPKLETKRLILDAFSMQQKDDLFEIFSSEKAMEFYDMDPYQMPEQVIELVELMDARLKNKTGLRWGLYLKENKKLIGTCGYNHFVENGKGNLGYDLNVDYWGNAYSTEAVKAIVEFGHSQLNIHRIEAMVSPGNVGSEKVLLKNNFSKEGVLRQTNFFRGKYQDQILYSHIRNVD